MKYIIAVIVFLIVAWIGIEAFNQVDAWIGYGIIIADVLGLAYYVHVQIKKDFNKKNN